MRLFLRSALSQTGLLPAYLLYSSVAKTNSNTVLSEQLQDYGVYLMEVSNLDIVEDNGQPVLRVEALHVN
jgi:hypothetical protein